MLNIYPDLNVFVDFWLVKSERAHKQSELDGPESGSGGHHSVEIIWSPLYLVVSHLFKSFLVASLQQGVELCNCPFTTRVKNVSSTSSSSSKILKKSFERSSAIFLQSSLHTLENDSKHNSEKHLQPIFFDPFKIKHPARRL